MPDIIRRLTGLPVTQSISMTWNHGILQMWEKTLFLVEMN